MIERAIQVGGILTKSNLPVADWSVNPYVGCAHACRYCYASFMKRFTGHGEDWGTFVDVKYWPAIRRKERYAGQELFLSSVTDPYQPCEERYGRTRALLEEMKDSGCTLSISTKSDLVLRDLDLIRSYPKATVAWSVNTLDEDFRREMDDAVSIERRLEAMRIFHESGVRTTCFISPIFPGITDVEAIVRRVEGQCDLIWLENLNLRGGFRKTIMDWIAAKRADLLPLYEEIYVKGRRDWWARLDEEIRAYASANGFPYLRAVEDVQRPAGTKPPIVNFFYHEEVRKSSRGGAGKRHNE